MPLPFDVDASWVNSVPVYDASELRRADAAGLAGDGTPSGVRGGIARQSDSSLAVAVDGSDIVTVQPGNVVIPGNAVDGGGCYRAGIAAAVTGGLQARDATYPRMDRVVFRQLDSEVVSSHAARTARIQVLPGSPGPTPSVPALPAMAVELARITVPAASGGAATVDSTWRTYAAAIGATIPVPTKDRLPAAAATGQKAIALDTLVEWTFDGTDWASGQWIALTSLAAAAGWSIATKRAYRGLDVVHLDIRATRTGASVTASAAGNLSDFDLATGLPTALRPSGDYYLPFNRNAIGAGSYRVSATGALTLTDMYPNNAVQNGDLFLFQGSYPLG